MADPAAGCSQETRDMEVPSQTITITQEQAEQKEKENANPVLKLKLTKPKTERVVKWGEGVVDNEHMNKKKSKCCCVYHKPRAFDESSSDESDNECGHCRGHKEGDFKGGHKQPAEGSSSSGQPQGTSKHE